MASGYEGKAVQKNLMKWLLTLLPLWLVVSSLLGLWLWHLGNKETEENGTAKFETPIKEEMISEDLEKWMTSIGPRHVGTDRGHLGLKRAAAIIQGSLGISNAGYNLEIIPGPEVLGNRWPIIVARLGTGDKPPIVVVSGYDAKPSGGGIEANATGVVSAMAVAQGVSGQRPDRPVLFCFVPHVYQEEAPVMDCINDLIREIPEPSLVLVVEAMGGGYELVISSRDAEALKKVEDYGKVVGAEAICLEDDFDLSSVLFELDLPAVRVSTQPIVKGLDDAMPDPDVHTAATKSLAAMILGLANE